GDVEVLGGEGAPARVRRDLGGRGEDAGGEQGQEEEDDPRDPSQGCAVPSRCPAARPRRNASIPRRCARAIRSWTSGSRSAASCCGIIRKLLSVSTEGIQVERITARSRQEIPRSRSPSARSSSAWISLASSSDCAWL